MSNTDAASVDGFDPSRPFTTRDGREVKDFRISSDGDWCGIVDKDIRNWKKPSGKHWLGFKRLDLINIPISTVAPIPAGDIAGEDDDGDITIHVASYEMGIRDALLDPDKARRCLEGHGPFMDEPGFPAARRASRMKLDGLAAEITREGARREPAGDGWQPIKTAPKDGTIVLLFVVHAPDNYTDALGEPRGWQHVDIGSFAGIGWEKLYSGEPTHWRTLPAAPSPVPSDTGGEEPRGCPTPGACSCPTNTGVDPSIRAMISDLTSLAAEHNDDAHESTAAFAILTRARKWLALPSATPTPCAGSGDEPVAWMLPENLKHSTDIWIETRRYKSNYFTVPLYAAPPASVDAVAVVTEAMCEAAWAEWDRLNDGDGLYRSHMKQVLTAALRAAQQSGEARS